MFARLVPGLRHVRPWPDHWRSLSTAQKDKLERYLLHADVSENARSAYHDFATKQETLRQATHEAQHSDDMELRLLFESSLPDLQRDVRVSHGQLLEHILGAHLPRTRGAILEVLAQRAGTDGADFSDFLLRMWQGLAGASSWKTRVLDADPIKISVPKPISTGGIGYRHLVLEVVGSDAWDLLQFERGVHRLTVMSWKGKLESTDVRVLAFPLEYAPNATSGSSPLYLPQDLRIDTMRSSGPGGQHVNKTESAVRVTHIPTSISVVSQTSRSQADNRQQALEGLQARLLAMKLEKQEESERIARNAAAKQDRIRTYQFHKDQLIEHRLAKSNPSNFLSLSAFADGRMYLRSILEQLREQGEIEKLDGFLSNIDKSS